MDRTVLRLSLRGRMRAGLHRDYSRLGVRVRLSVRHAEYELPQSCERLSVVSRGASRSAQGQFSDGNLSNHSTNWFVTSIVRCTYVNRKGIRCTYVLRTRGSLLWRSWTIFSSGTQTKFQKKKTCEIPKQFIKSLKRAMWLCDHGPVFDEERGGDNVSYPKFKETPS